MGTLSLVVIIVLLRLSVVGLEEKEMTTETSLAIEERFRALARMLIDNIVIKEPTVFGVSIRLYALPLLTFAFVWLARYLAGVFMFQNVLYELTRSFGLRRRNSLHRINSCSGTTL